MRLIFLLAPQGITTGSFVRYRVAVEAVWNHKPFPGVVPAGVGGAADPCSTSTAVLRRYSDFDWLYHRLVTTAPNCFVPLLPPKVLALPAMSVRGGMKGLLATCTQLFSSEVT
jgi:hypothetical protein